MDVFAHGLFAVVGALAFFPLSLPTGGSPEIAGEGVGQRVRDVPNELVLAVTHDAHGVVHLDFVKGVARVDAVPVLRIFLGKDGEERATVKFVRTFFGAATAGHHRQFGLGGAVLGGAAGAVTGAATDKDDINLDD